MGLIFRFLLIYVLLISAGMLATSGLSLGLAFIAYAIILLTIGRKVGWTYASYFIYPRRRIIAGMMTAVWASSVAVTVDLMIAAWQPGWKVKWLFGYLLGLYVAKPGFSLFSRMVWRDRFVAMVSIAVYVATLVLQQVRAGNL